MTCCHHYSVYTAFAKHIIVPFHPSHHLGLRFCHSLSWNINWELRNGSRGLAFFFLAGVRNKKITVQVSWGQDLKKKGTWAFQSLTTFFFEDFFFEILIYFNFSNPSTSQKIDRRRFGAFNWFLPLQALCVRSWCLERCRRFIALPWSKTPWSQSGKRPEISDWIFL